MLSICVMNNPYFYVNLQGRVRVLEEQCRGLEGELARVRVEVLKMVEERDQLVKQKDLLEQVCSIYFMDFSSSFYSLFLVDTSINSVGLILPV